MNNTIEDGHEPKQVYALVFGCIMAVGLPLNAFSLWILLRHHGVKSPSIVFMINLAISDLLLVISLPMRIYLYATGTWPLSQGACIWITMLFRDNIRSSSIFITFISVDRLLAVVYPLRSRHLRTASNAWKGAGLAWLFVCVVNIPERFEFKRTVENYNASMCFEYHRERMDISAMAYFQSVLVLTMLSVNVVCTVLVLWTLHRRLSDSARVNNKVNVMLIFIMNLVMFTVCFLPLSFGVFMSRVHLTPLVCVTTANCCLDPLLYYFSLDAFWKKKEGTEPARQQ